MQEWLNRKAEEHVTSFWQLQEVTMEKRGAAGRQHHRHRHQNHSMRCGSSQPHTPHHFKSIGDGEDSRRCELRQCSRPGGIQEKQWLSGPASSARGASRLSQTRTTMVCFPLPAQRRGQARRSINETWLTMLMASHKNGRCGAAAIAFGKVTMTISPYLRAVESGTREGY